jgi:hypothetical protein
MHVCVLFAEWLMHKLCMYVCACAHTHIRVCIYTGAICGVAVSSQDDGTVTVVTASLDVSFLCMICLNVYLFLLWSIGF